MKALILIALLLIAEAVRRLDQRRRFRKNPVGMRCRFLARHGWIKGNVQCKITEGSYYVYANDGNLWRTSAEYMKPVYFEL